MNRLKIHHKIRLIVTGTKERPRLCVYRSLNNIQAQMIDDVKGVTLVSASSIKLNGNLINKAKEVGSEIAKIAKTKKITSAVFDRGGFAYSGAVKALAESAREGGIKI